MGIDVIVVCPGAREEWPVPRRSEHSSARDAYHLPDNSFNTCVWEETWGGGVWELDQRAIDEARVHAAETNGEGDVSLDRWQKLEAWCQRHWEAGYATLVLMDNLEAHQGYLEWRARRQMRVDVWQVIGHAFPPEGGRILAEHLLHQTSDQWANLVLDASRCHSGQVISGLINGFLTQVHEQRPALLARARAIQWEAQFPFQLTNIKSWLRAFKGR